MTEPVDPQREQWRSRWTSPGGGDEQPPRQGGPDGPESSDGPDRQSGSDEPGRGPDGPERQGGLFEPARPARPESGDPGRAPAGGTVPPPSGAMPPPSGPMPPPSGAMPPPSGAMPPPSGAMPPPGPAPHPGAMPPPAAYGTWGGHPYQPATQPLGQPTQPMPGAPGAPGAPQAPGAPGTPRSTQELFRPAEQPPRDRGRGPGWGATVAIAGVAALLASALTAGGVTLADRIDDRAGSFSGGSTNEPPAPGPVEGSTASAPDWKAVAAAVEPSIVAVQLRDGQGSGVLLDAAGHVLTNNHVVASGGSMGVVLADGRGYQAEVVGTDPTTDLAVIKVKDAPKGLRPVALGDSSAVKVGDPVMVVGNPLGLAGTVTTGIVSAVDRPITTEVQERQEPRPDDPFGFFRPGPQTTERVVTNAIQTDAAINPGNSGGALVDVQGRLIGVPSSIATLGGGLGGPSGNIGLGFAIPVNQAKDVAQQLIASGRAEHPWLGVELGDEAVEVDGAQRMAAVIGRVESGSPADKAGLKEKDGVIAVDGERVNGSDSLVAQLRERRPGRTVTLTVARGGKPQDIQVELGTRPQNPS